MLAAGLCLSYYQTPAVERRRRLALLFGALPAVAGIMAVTNTWSFPSMGGLALLTVTVAPADPTTLVPGDIVQRLGLTDRIKRGISIWDGAGSYSSVHLRDNTVMNQTEVAYGERPRDCGSARPDLALELLAVHGLFVAPFWLYLYAQTGRLRQSTAASSVS